MKIIRLRFTRTLMLITFILVAAVAFAGPAAVEQSWAAEEDTEVYQGDYEDMRGWSIGVMMGSVQEEMAGELVPDVELKYYETFTDVALAISQGKVDCGIIPRPASYLILDQNPDLVADERIMGTNDVSFVFPQTSEGESLQGEFNSFIAEYKDAGKMQEAIDKWMVADMPEEEPHDFDALPATNGTINYVSIINIPYCYKSGEGFQGMEMDILYDFCSEYGYSAKISSAPMASILAGVSTSTYDMGGGGILYTDERAESLYFGDIFYTVAQLIIVKSDEDGSGAGFFSTIKDKLKVTFVTENRWLLIVNGLLITLLISACAFILSLAVGSAIAAMMLSKRKIWNRIAYVYNRIAQGVPVLVILLMFYYAVFANLDLSGVIVSILVFGLYVGSSMGELFESSINSVDKGELEAGRALGLSGRQLFRGIVFPQALAKAIRGIRSQFVSLIMGTSVVGYIAVEDLTRASDLIRTRSFEAFAPLLVTAVIYFLLTWGVTRAMQAAADRTDPKYKRDKKIRSGREAAE